METSSGRAKHGEHEAGESGDSKSPQYLEHLTEEAEKIAVEVQTLSTALEKPATHCC